MNTSTKSLLVAVLGLAFSAAAIAGPGPQYWNRSTSVPTPKAAAPANNGSVLSLRHMLMRNTGPAQIGFLGSQFRARPKCCEPTNNAGANAVLPCPPTGTNRTDLQTHAHAQHRPDRITGAVDFGELHAGPRENQSRMSGGLPDVTRAVFSAKKSKGFFALRRITLLNATVRTTKDDAMKTLTKILFAVALSGAAISYAGPGPQFWNRATPKSTANETPVHVAPSTANSGLLCAVMWIPRTRRTGTLHRR